MIVLKTMKILIATGGTGGHIIPALVTARELKRRGHDIVFAGVFRHAGSKLKDEGFDYHEISAKGFSTRSFSALAAFFVASVKSFFESVKILKQVKPDAVAGFGGYGSFWVVFAAVGQGFPTMIQEQNVKPGKANKLLSFFVKRIAVGFADAEKSLPAKKTVVTGCPLRPIKTQFDRRAILAQFGLADAEGVPVILALGGSQGSLKINDEMIRAAVALKDKVAFSMIHICGEKDVEKCKAAYQSAGIRHCVLGFTDEIDKAYAIADLAVSRSGAMTVTELAAFGLPVIFIPYPYAGGHQRENAMVLAKTGLSVILDEKDLTADSLLVAILDLLKQKKTKDEMNQAYRGIYRPNAAVLLADEAERLKR
jgi:UDP-N-acetylglucosamine--N-acetylmuramyl-(pentapeptide) pyrophosphoryl-undecaprenol N-acetylglucosamine transferase